MPRKVLVYRFVRTTVKSEIVLIVLKAGEGTENLLSAGCFVDAGLDIEVSHLLHFAGTELSYLNRGEGSG